MNRKWGQGVFSTTGGALESIHVVGEVEVEMERCVCVCASAELPKVYQTCSYFFKNGDNDVLSV